MKTYTLVVILWLGAVQAFFVPEHRQLDSNTINDETLFKLFNELTPATSTTPAPTTPRISTTSAVPEDTSCGLEGGFGYKGSGSKAEFANYKWTIAIIDKRNGSYTCAGSLIHPQIVLSSGHWFKRPGRWSARAGEFQLSKTHEPMIHETRDISQILIHPQMNHFMNNIALLFLEKPFTLTFHIGVVCLPPPGTAPPAGTEGSSTGWGHDKHNGELQDVMKLVDPMIIFDRDSCIQMYRNIGSRFFNLDSKTFCVLGLESDTCLRDGGAPFVVPFTNERARYYQAGIVSAGVDCGTGVPGLYVDVAAMRTWIDEEVTKRGYSTSFYTYIPN